MHMPYFPHDRADTFRGRALYMYLSSKSGSRRGLGDMVCGFSPETRRWWDWLWHRESPVCKTSLSGDTHVIHVLYT